MAPFMGIWALTELGAPPSRLAVAYLLAPGAASAAGFAGSLAYGAFFIPKSFGSSIAMTGSAAFALYGFLAFYLSCIAITWFFYTRKGGLLFDVERRRPAAPAAVATPAQ